MGALCKESVMLAAVAWCRAPSLVPLAVCACCDSLWVSSSLLLELSRDGKDERLICWWLCCGLDPGQCEGPLSACRGGQGGQKEQSEVAYAGRQLVGGPRYRSRGTTLMERGVGGSRRLSVLVVLTMGLSSRNHDALAPSGALSLSCRGVVSPLSLIRPTISGDPPRLPLMYKLDEQQETPARALLKIPQMSKHRAEKGDPGYLPKPPPQRL
ncbi:hypothetical protein BX600DRAFT_250023 [Xylariales sp. PMI_506]|nr:hypothetical protein BX600DRAFT_250023 [Xylariales sp. PMI_506]